MKIEISTLTFTEKHPKGKIKLTLQLHKQGGLAMDFGKSDKGLGFNKTVTFEKIKGFIVRKVTGRSGSQ